MHQLFILAWAVTLLHASAASACINDRETTRTEEEFKNVYELRTKQELKKVYEFKSGFTPETKSSYDSPGEKEWIPTAAAGSGAGLLALAAGLVRINLRKMKRD